MRKRYFSYGIFTFSVFICLGVYGFKKFKTASSSDCFCESVSETVSPSIILRVENANEWETGSYHLINWKKSCNISRIELTIVNEDQTILQEESFHACDSGYLFKVPEHASKKLKITISGTGAKGSKITYDSRFITTKTGDHSKYEWELISEHAPFLERDGAVSATINNKMFLYGGWNPFEKKQTNNEMWSSENGKDWQFLGNAPWEIRHCAGRANFKNKFWIIGGDCNQGYYQNDIWSTEDGIHWTKMLDSIPWQPRMNFGVQVFDNKIWLLGGERTNSTVAEDVKIFDDVYYSEDGINWVKSPDPLPGARAHLGRFSGFDKLYLVGANAYKNKISMNDVWTSDDGIKWKKILETAPWKRKSFSNFIEFDNKLWMMGGSDQTGNSNEVWYTSDGYNWYQMEDIQWEPRHASSLFNFKGSIFLTAGYLYNDVWRLKKI